MAEPTKPRYRVPAGSAHNGSGKAFVSDSFVNFAADLGIGARNVASGGTYGFNPISRNHTLLEWAYRGSWLVRKIVDVPADDMTREGVTIDSDLPPDQIDELNRYWDNLQLWQRLNSTLKWSRLYGGAIAVIIIDGQDPATPLRPDTVGRDQFKGLLVADRWMAWPNLSELVRDLGPDFGTPTSYTLISDGSTMDGLTVHHSRCIRFDGVELPYFQRMAENQWGLSVIEPLWDRLLAFDSATQGSAQLVYKAHLRWMKVRNYRELIAQGGEPYEGFKRQMNFNRVMASNEGMTVLDSTDEYGTVDYSFAGLSEMIAQFAQQLSGGADIPATRMFGQSPLGMNATGESDNRNYYDHIDGQRESKLRRPVLMLYDLSHRSLYGGPLPKGFGITFNSLWQLSDEEKTGIATNVTNTVVAAVEGGLVSQQTALKELRQSARVTGVWSNITDEDLEAALTEPPVPGEESMVTGKEVLQPGQEPTDLPEAEPPGEQQLFENDAVRDSAALPMRDVAGLTVVIETPKGERRAGPGWSVQMPSDYGYISGTSSAEGPMEQMDCFVGDAPESEIAWVIEQLDPATGLFDEHKVMLGFESEDHARSTYASAFSDGKGEQRIGKVRRLHVDRLRDWLGGWRYARKEP